jgi:hypothetical protein
VSAGGRVRQRAAVLARKLESRRRFGADVTTVRANGRWWFSPDLRGASRHALHWRHVEAVHTVLEAAGIAHAVMPDPGTGRADVAVASSASAAARSALRDHDLRRPLYTTRHRRKGAPQLVSDLDPDRSGVVEVFERWSAAGTPGLTGAELACRLVVAERGELGTRLVGARRAYLGWFADEDLAPVEIETAGRRWPSYAVADRVLDDTRSVEVRLIEPAALRRSDPATADVLATAAARSWRHFAAGSVLVHPVQPGGPGGDVEQLGRALTEATRPHLVLHPTTTVLTSDVDLHDLFPTSALAAAFVSRRSVDLVDDGGRSPASLAAAEARSSGRSFTRLPHQGPHAFVREVAHDLAGRLGELGERSGPDLALQELFHLPFWWAFDAGGSVIRRLTSDQLEPGHPAVTTQAIAARSGGAPAVLSAVTAEGDELVADGPRLRDVLATIVP